MAKVITHQEYMQRDLELQERISFYRTDSATKQAEIAMNEKEIIALEHARCVLRKEYADSEYANEKSII